ncbi:MAG: ABC transporter permease [Planctomycetota bacterium]
MWNPLAALGRRTLSQAAAFADDALSLGAVFSRTLAATAHTPRGAWRLTRRTTVMQVYFTGVQGVPVAGFLAALIGYGLGQLVASSGLFVVVPPLRDLLVTQVGPLIAALVIVARSSPAVAVELGNMHVGGELRMLEGFGIDPYRFLALPRLLGITFGTVALCFLTTLFALAALYVGVREIEGVGGSLFWLAIRPEQGLHVGLLGAAFGISIALVSLHQGFSLLPFSTEVPKAASRAVVKSLVLCALVDLLVTVLA